MAEEKEQELAKPTPQQVAWQDMEMGMFIHFGPETWQDEEEDNLSTPMDQINPNKLDTDQWVYAAEMMGAKYIVFVTKGSGGFCNWQTSTTDYSIKSTPWRGGKGDIMRDLSESCRKRGTKLGVYLSPADAKHGAPLTWALAGYSGPQGYCRNPKAQPKYDKMYRQQLTELLSCYGEMMEVWFDGSTKTEVGDILKKYAPNAMVFGSKYATIRWVGNEDGFAPYPTWNVVSQAVARSSTWLPVECDARIRSTWFWNTRNADTLKSVHQLMEMYYNSVGYGTNLLLDLAPDTSGSIPEADVKRAAEFCAEIKRRFGESIAETEGEGDVIELSLGEPTTIDHVIIVEDIAQGERVREYAVEGLVDGNWQEICEGTAIGHKKIDRFTPVNVSEIRFRCTKSAATPILRKLAVYNTTAKS